MSEIKNAVVVGKVDLKPRQTLVSTKGETGKRVIEGKIEIREKPRREPRQERPRQMKRADDGRAAQASNQAMLQELNFIKGQLRKLQDERSKVGTDYVLFAADVRRLVEELKAGDPNHTSGVFSTEAYERVAKALGV